MSTSRSGSSARADPSNHTIIDDDEAQTPRSDSDEHMIHENWHDDDDREEILRYKEVLLSCTSPVNNL